MSYQLRLSFWEREFFLGSKDGEYVEGYEPAFINDGKKVRAGRVIDFNKLMQSDYEDREMYACEFPLSNISLNLEELMSANFEGQCWLRAHQSYFREVFRKTMPLSFSLKLAEMPSVHYVLFNNRNTQDYLSPAYFRRIPEGTLTALPPTCHYVLVRVPLQFSDGEFAPNIYYNLNALNCLGAMNSYSLEMLPRRQLVYAPGILLGALEEKDMKLHRGNLHGETPLNHLLEVTYPVSMRDTQHNSLTIRVELVKPAERI